MIQVVARDADDHMRGQEGPGDVHGHVSLAEVYTIRLDGQGDVDPVIDDQGYSVLVTQHLGLLGNFKELTCADKSGDTRE